MTRGPRSPEGPGRLPDPAVDLEPQPHVALVRELVDQRPRLALERGRLAVEGEHDRVEDRGLSRPDGSDDPDEPAPPPIEDLLGPVGAEPTERQLKRSHRPPRGSLGTRRAAPPAARLPWRPCNSPRRAGPMSGPPGSSRPCPRSVAFGRAREP